MAEKFRTELQDVLEVEIAAGNLDLSKRKTMQFPCHFSKEFEDLPIDELTQDARAVNGLKRDNIFTIGKLIERFDEVYKIRNVGKKTVQIIRVSLMDLYYQSLDTVEKKAQFIKEIIELNSGTPDPVVEK